MSENSASTEVVFGQTEFKANAAVYRRAKGIIDAASKYDNVEDAIAALTEAWEALEVQIENGAGYTPDRELGFGSDSAAVIAETLLGRRAAVGTVRKNFSALGK